MNENLLNKQIFLKYPILKKLLILAGENTLVILAVYCTFGALISSFSFTVDMGELLIIWLPCSIIVSTFTMIYRGKGILMLMIPSFLLFLWWMPGIIEGAKWVIYKITDMYSEWISIAVLFPESSTSVDEAMLFFAVAGVAVTFLLAYSICLRRSVFCTIISTAPIVFLTFVITDYQADLFFLIGLIAVYLTILVSSALNPDDYQKRGLTLIPAFLVTMVFMFIAFLFAPNESYEREGYIISLGNRLRYAASQLGSFGGFWQMQSGISFSDFGWLEIHDGSTWQFNTNNVNISNAGKRVITDQRLLEVNTSVPGTFYIRGYSMQHFDGSSWLISDEVYYGTDIEIARLIHNEIHDFPENTPLQNIARAMPAHIAEHHLHADSVHTPVPASMRIRRTGDLTSGIRYQPYYGAALFDENILSLDLETVENFMYLEGSILDLAGTPELRRLADNLLLEYFARQTSIHDRYTVINESTRRSLRQMAIGNGIDPTADRAAVVDAVAKYIISSGSYTLTPGVVPAGEDFALYFLQTLKEGYCIHFATAATLMLRSLDIPARFTSGYVITVPRGSEGSNVVLTDRDAHAWVEVFYEDVGWLYLEVTPPSAGSTVPESRPHTPENPTPEPPPTPTPPQPPVETSEPPEQLNPGITPPGTQTGADGQTVSNLSVFIINVGMLGAGICLCASALIIRRVIVRKRRAKRFEQENTNAAVICMWRYITRLGRREVVPPADIEELALKARFSQHRITAEERRTVRKYADRLAFEVYSGKGDYGRFWLKYIRVLY